jgi:hypothetical protein
MPQSATSSNGSRDIAKLRALPALAAQRTPGHTHRAMRFFLAHARRKSVRFCRLSRSRNDYLCERFSPLTRAATVVDLPEARMSDGRDAGAAPAGSTIGLYARATTREPRRSGLRRLRKQQGEGLAAPSVCETRSRREWDRRWRIRKWGASKGPAAGGCAAE